MSLLCDWNTFVKYNCDDVNLLRNIFDERVEKDVNVWYHNEKFRQQSSTLIEYYTSRASFNKTHRN